MSTATLADVYTADELARAARVPKPIIDALIAAGDVRLVPGTNFIAPDEAIRIGRRFAPSPLSPRVYVARPEFLSTTRTDLAGRRTGFPAATSAFAHGLVLGLLVWWTAAPATTRATEQRLRDDTRLVFVVSPGPGGGGGGGGLRNPAPAPKVERKGVEQARAAIPAVTLTKVLTTARRDIEPPRRPTPAPAPPEPKLPEVAPEPLPSNVLVAPVVASASNSRDREGVIENPRGTADSHGSGAGGGSGSGAGTGSGEGSGSGIGAGSGGGTGGGPFRPGSGIEPPRLLREVKADFTEEARRRGVSGEVVLEIIVRRDGSVGDVTVLQGLGSGLDGRAVAAVRQWRFDPARRRGVPVDVIVEVAVEFTLR